MSPPAITSACFQTRGCSVVDSVVQLICVLCIKSGPPIMNDILYLNCFSDFQARYVQHAEASNNLYLKIT